MVKAAIQNSGSPLPFERISVNLGPAVFKKEVPGFLSCWDNGASSYC